MIRYYLKSVTGPDVYAVEADETAGAILAVMDLTDEADRGGVCPHILASLPMAGRIDDIERVITMRDRGELHEHVPECGNVHHLMADLIALESAHRQASNAYEMADAQAKASRKAMESAGLKVHQTLAKILDRKPLPLFDAAGV